jgi:hypothetical protein
MGRRFVVGIGIVALSLLGVASEAGAAPPTTAGSGPPVGATLSFGTYPCGFDLELEVLANNLTERTFTRGGVQTVRTTGTLKVRLTNGTTEESIVRNISGPVELTFNADGTITQVASGPSFTILEPGVKPLDLPRAIITRGRVVSHFETWKFEGFSIESQSGSYEDVCAVLS